LHNGPLNRVVNPGGTPCDATTDGEPDTCGIFRSVPFLRPLGLKEVNEATKESAGYFRTWHNTTILFVASKLSI